MTYKNSIFALALKEQAHGAIAQLVEQRTENPCVPGSIPGGTTPPFIMPFTSLRSVSGFLFLRACRVLVHGRSMTVGRRRPVVFQKLVEWRPRGPLLPCQRAAFARRLLSFCKPKAQRWKIVGRVWLYERRKAESPTPGDSAFRMKWCRVRGRSLRPSSAC